MKSLFFLFGAAVALTAPASAATPPSFHCRDDLGFTDYGVGVTIDGSALTAEVEVIGFIGTQELRTIANLVFRSNTTFGPALISAEGFELKVAVNAQPVDGGYVPGWLKTAQHDIPVKCDWPADF